MHSSNKLATPIRLKTNVIFFFVSLIFALTLVLGTGRLVAAQAVYPSWSFTGCMNVGRRFHTATLLLDGKVLIAGGLNNCGSNCTLLNSAELYDPTLGTWSLTGNLNRARAYHTATLLTNGKVLIVGGAYSGFPDPSGSVELYDPATGQWTIAGNLHTPREFHTATPLQNGKVLVAGGYNFAAISSAELYDPDAGTWSNTGNLNKARLGTATRLLNGKVLIATGDNIAGDGNSAELYDPATGNWSNTGNLNCPHFGTSTLLPSGKVLLAGVSSGMNNAELYDPATGTWSTTGNSNYSRAQHNSTLLPDGRVLITAGDTSGAFTGSSEWYDPATEKWSLTAYLNSPRWGQTATLLVNGRVLVAGGADNSYNDLNTSELYDAGSSPNLNMVDDAQFFVHQHYLDFLNREPDAGGFAFWKNQIVSCGADAQCIEIKRINVSAAFYLSIEFQETGYFVYRVNKAAHGNLAGAPVPVKLDDFLRETRFEVGMGVVVGQPGWEQTLEFNKRVFINDPDGDRWTFAYPTSMTPAEFVDTLFANAEVTPSTAERSAAINEFGAFTTTSDIPARQRALRRVVENPTLARQEFNRAFVLMQYFGYLRRNPNDPPEPTLDFQGYDFWLSKLNQFNGNFVNAEMVKAFITSTEYRQRFGP